MGVGEMGVDETGLGKTGIPLLFMLVTTQHAKHALNYEYLILAGIVHILESVLERSGYKILCANIFSVLQCFC